MESALTAPDCTTPIRFDICRLTDALENVAPSGHAPGPEGLHHAGRKAPCDACKGTEGRTIRPARLAEVGDRVELENGRLESAFFLLYGVTSDDDSQ